MRCNDFPSVRIKHLGTFCVPNSLKRKHEETMDYFKKYYDEFNKEYKEGSTESLSKIYFIQVISGIIVIILNIFNG